MKTIKELNVGDWFLSADGNIYRFEGLGKKTKIRLIEGKRFDDGSEIVWSMGELAVIQTYPLEEIHQKITLDKLNISKNLKAIRKEGERLTTTEWKLQFRLLHIEKVLLGLERDIYEALFEEARALLVSTEVHLLAPKDEKALSDRIKDFLYRNQNM